MGRETVGEIALGRWLIPLFRLFAPETASARLEDIGDTVGGRFLIEHNLFSSPCSDKVLATSSPRSETFRFLVSNGDDDPDISGKPVVVECGTAATAGA